MCEVLTRDAWESSVNSNIMQKVKCCGEQLFDWGRDLTGNFGSRIKACKAELKKLRNKRDQQSQDLWLHSSDKNSRYFHVAACTRRRNNQIQRLLDDEGHWVEWDTGLADIISNYFTDIVKVACTNWQ